ncbi:MAG: DUF6261 family protein [Tannerellaceae bacterium]|nr:DUF6261 family protein [Tannerellaceae bacterium]
MKNFISFAYKTLMRHLHNAEHVDFYESGIISKLAALIASLPIVGPVFAVLIAAFQKEDALFKQSQASVYTGRIAWLHEKRIGLYNFFWNSVNVVKYYEDPLLTPAAEALQFLRHNYKDLPEANYTDANGLMTNFIEDCDKPEWQQHIQTLGLAPLFAKIKTAHNEFKDIYRERSFDKEHLAQIGKLNTLRAEVDASFTSVIESINASWIANEYGAKDAAVRAALLESKEHIGAAIHQAELVLARRGTIHPPHKKDDGTQTPDTSLPGAPPTPPQAPDANPPAINPDDLNPPAVGEL